MTLGLVMVTIIGGVVILIPEEIVVMLVEMATLMEATMKAVKNSHLRVPLIISIFILYKD